MKKLTLVFISTIFLCEPHLEQIHCLSERARLSFLCPQLLQGFVVAVHCPT